MYDSKSTCAFTESQRERERERESERESESERERERETEREWRRGERKFVTVLRRWKSACWAAHSSWDCHLAPGEQAVFQIN